MHDNIVSLFGEKLATLIHKSPTACKGLIRFAIRAHRKEQNTENAVAISMGEMEIIVKSKIKRLLEQADISNLEEIIADLINEITLQQAIFTMNS